MFGKESWPPFDLLSFFRPRARKQEPERQRPPDRRVLAPTLEIEPERRVQQLARDKNRADMKAEASAITGKAAWQIEQGYGRTEDERAVIRKAFANARAIRAEADNSMSIDMER